MSTSDSPEVGKSAADGSVSTGSTRASDDPMDVERRRGSGGDLLPPAPVGKPCRRRVHMLRLWK